jgi:hypothetical protein
MFKGGIHLPMRRASRLSVTTPALLIRVIRQIRGFTFLEMIVYTGPLEDSRLIIEFFDVKPPISGFCGS